MSHTPEVLTLFIINILLICFATVAFFLSVRIVKKYDPKSSTSLQYKLQKESYLASVIIKFLFFIKIPLFLFFIFTLDKLSELITGAMCAAGVVDATGYGNYLFVLKILNLYLFALWLLLHERQSSQEEPPYFKEQYLFFIFLYLVLIAEFVLEIFMFEAIELDAIVDCCGTLYSNATTSYIGAIFRINTPLLLSFFYANVLLLLFAYRYKKSFVFSLGSLLFLVIALVSLIAFFGTYIYEMPTHHCPFCFLQKEYYYIGYILYILLFYATFHGIAGFFVQERKRAFKAIIAVVLYTAIVSGYVLSYYLRNGVWL